MASILLNDIGDQDTISQANSANSWASLASTANISPTSLMNANSDNSIQSNNVIRKNVRNQKRHSSPAAIKVPHPMDPIKEHDSSPKIMIEDLNPSIPLSNNYHENFGLENHESASLRCNASAKQSFKPPPQTISLNYEEVLVRCDLLQQLKSELEKVHLIARKQALKIKNQEMMIQKLKCSTQPVELYDLQDISPQERKYYELKMQDISQKDRKYYELKISKLSGVISELKQRIIDDQGGYKVECEILKQKLGNELYKEKLLTQSLKKSIHDLQVSKNRQKNEFEGSVAKYADHLRANERNFMERENECLKKQCAKLVQQQECESFSALLSQWRA